MIQNDMKPIISAQDLTKCFGSFTAVNRVNFTVNQGEFFGLLGPNGAGKTSIASMIYGLSPVTSGTLKVFDKNIELHARQIKANIGVVAQEDNLDPELTVRENLLVYSTYFNISKIEADLRTQQILEFMDLTDKADAIVDELSGGMKRRLTIGRALINQPELLILDEPTTGLDPYARHLVWQRLRQLKDKGTTILLTTHYLEEASQLCDRLIVLSHGRIIEEGTPDGLISQHVGNFAMEIEIDASFHDLLLKCCSQWLITHQIIGNHLYIYSNESEKLTEALTACTAEHKLPIRYQRLRPTNLEDVFLKLSGESLEGTAAL